MLVRAFQLAFAGAPNLNKWQPWERGMSKKPAFEIRPSKNGQSWLVFHINKNNRRSHTYEFASEKAARNWINYESQGWLKKYYANSTRQ
jgi:hypothetical protein